MPNFDLAQQPGQQFENVRLFLRKAPNGLWAVTATSLSLVL